MIDAEETVATEEPPTDPGTPPDDVPVGDPPRRAAAGRSLPVAVLVPWLLAGLVTAIAVVLAVLLADARAVTGQINAVEEAAGRFALHLTAWDASDGMGDTRDALQAASTDGFADEIDELFGGTGDLADLERLGARSEAQVEDVLVQSLEGDEATAMVVIVQRITTDVSEGADVSLRYARIDLERQGGTWLVASVELVVDVLQEAARTPAEGGS